MKTVLAALILLAGTAAQAQVEIQNVVEAEGAILRGLDTATGSNQDIDINVGETKQFERLEIKLDACRYPKENPAGDAFAYLTIKDVREDTPRFVGWMIASAPALSAMDHPRYDVWVLHCKFPESAAVKGPVKPDQEPDEHPIVVDPDTPSD